ncbi:predicted protein [Histoplasma capsulatum G186AR]|uniref:Uncharacterized protein n=1 Tax=Ajellomyces capsulatus (strain G186AR / H82 / ATCC MYA-2454 / RMSCC 2432) TaxID=447093 RepID=C0NZM9_AJECG|nr:uncharacterized protein HCBG_08609 [Histoplasma capsulatum G186AR]EEH03277.1 predicted protein [Histoplasma capsulatum G186AR]
MFVLCARARTLEVPIPPASIESKWRHYHDDDCRKSRKSGQIVGTNFPQKEDPPNSSSLELLNSPSASNNSSQWGVDYRATPSKVAFLVCPAPGPQLPAVRSSADISIMASHGMERLCVRVSANRRLPSKRGQFISHNSAPEKG